MNSKINFSLVCLHCGSTYKKTIKYSINRYKTFRFCCRRCYVDHGDKTQYRKGHKGICGAQNYAWAGDKCSYSTLHSWVHRWKARTEKCEHCGAPDGHHPSGRRILEAANISGKYKRDLNDWMWLCSPCHSRFDKGRNSISELIAEGRKF